MHIDDTDRRIIRVKEEESFGAEIGYNNKDINKNINGVTELLKRNLWESASPKLIRGDKDASLYSLNLQSKNSLKVLLLDYRHQVINLDRKVIISALGTPAICSSCHHPANKIHDLCSNYRHRFSCILLTHTR